MGPRWGHSPEIMRGGSGARALSQILSDESLSYCYRSNWGLPSIMGGMASDSAHSCTLITIP